MSLTTPDNIRTLRRELYGKKHAPAKALRYAHMSCRLRIKPKKTACPTRRGYDSLRAGNRRTGAVMEWSLGSFGDLRLDKGGCDPRTDGCAQDRVLAPARG